MRETFDAREQSSDGREMGASVLSPVSVLPIVAGKLGEKEVFGLCLQRKLCSIPVVATRRSLALDSISVQQGEVEWLL